MTRQRPPDDGREVVTIAGCQFLRNGEWLFWCRCDALVSLSNVTNDRCAKCNTDEVKT